MIGSWGTSYLMIAIAIFDGVCYGHDIITDAIYTIDLTDGSAAYLGSTGIAANYAQDMASDLNEIDGDLFLAAYTTCGGLYDVDIYTGRCTLLGQFEGGAELTGFAIPYSSCPCPPFYIPLGVQDIDAIAKNYGTFPEYNLTCFAEIFEYCTNISNGTLVYEDVINNIDIEEPLGGTELLNFKDYDFAVEGVYKLKVNLSCSLDDDLRNNKEGMKIVCDASPPSSSHEIIPPDPDGDNGWYKGDVKVILTALDPKINFKTRGSGVHEIIYKIGSGSWHSIPGYSGKVKIEENSENLEFQYYALDNVGNVEPSIHSFYINVDQQKPIISYVEWQSYKDPPFIGEWFVKFSCYAEDTISGMDRVEMYINEGLSEKIAGIGPLYEFVIEWSSVFDSSIFNFEHYDIAGNMIERDIQGSSIESYPDHQNKQESQSKKHRLTPIQIMVE